MEGVIFDPIYRVKAIWSQHMRKQGEELIIDASTIKIKVYSDSTLLDGPKLSNI